MNVNIAYLMHIYIVILLPNLAYNHKSIGSIFLKYEIMH